MPRIRTIKPEFWTDGDVVDMSYAARLLFIGSWNFAICDRGHVADDAKRLKMQVLPADDADAATLIDEIIARGRMERLTAPDGRTYLLIKRFTDHQKIERRWNPRCPACDAFGLNETPENLSEPPRTSREFGRDTPHLSETPPTSAQEGRGGERRGKNSSSEIASAIPDQPSDREDVERLCNHLADRIEANGAKRPTITKRWRDSARLLIDKDDRTEPQVAWIIDWATADEFWRSNILSMPTLREKFDQLVLKARPQAVPNRPASEDPNAWMRRTL